MLQDIAFGRLENEFKVLDPEVNDRVVCIRAGEILLNPDGSLPTASQVISQSESWQKWEEAGLRYVFRMEEENYFIFMGLPGDAPEGRWENARNLRQSMEKDSYYACMTAWHLYNWYASSRFCGRCGNKTKHDEKERMMRCPECGNLIFPKISPAVIVGVTDGDRILLTKYAGRAFTRYALIAGYTEIGETMEQTVSREVMEEVGLKVKNIRYYKSQPWGVDGNVLMGFFCDLDGDDTVTLDENELAVAEWHTRDNFPAEDDGISLTREMMRVFAEGKEPK
jgi:NAD+ diphosphatase